MRNPRLLNSNRKIRLHPHTVFFNVEDAIIIKKNNALFRLSGKDLIELHQKLFPLIVGPKKIEDILDYLSNYEQDSVLDFIASLQKCGLITEDSDYPSQIGDLKITSSIKVSQLHSKYDQRFSNIHVLLIGDGVLASKISSYLKVKGISVNSLRSNLDNITKQSQSDFTIMKKKLLQKMLSNNYDMIIAAQDYDSILFFENINDISFQKRIPWLRVSFDGNIGLLGPLTIAGESSCYQCYLLRSISNSPDYEYQLWKYKTYFPTAKLQVPEVFADVLAALSIEEVFRYFTKKNEPQTVGNVVTLGTEKISITAHEILMHPNCECCRPFFNYSQNQLSKNHTGNSNYLTFDRLKGRLNQLIDEKTGIIINTDQIFSDNSIGIKYHHFFRAQQFNARISHKRPPDSRECYGCGFSPIEAEIHALMEAVERYAFMIIDESRFHWSSYNSVKGKSVNPVD